MKRTYFNKKEYAVSQQIAGLPLLRLAQLTTFLWGVFVAAASAFLLESCTTEPYESGDGELSYMRADFVEANTDSEKNVVSVKTDDGLTFFLSPSLTAKWVTVADTTYRALVYYNTQDDLQDGATVKPLALSPVAVTKVIKNGIISSATAFATDPVLFETAWEKGGRYINLGLQLKTGATDGKTEAQTLGMLYTGTETTPSGGRLHKLKLLHSQNGVPEYYSAQVYVSVPLYNLPFDTASGDSILISINTYDGETNRIFAVK